MTDLQRARTAEFLSRLIVIVLLLALVLVAIGVQPARPAHAAESGVREATCPDEDLTGRELALTSVWPGIVRCKYSRNPDDAVCPLNTPQGLTLVAVIPVDGKDKVICEYQALAPLAAPAGFRR